MFKLVSRPHPSAWWRYASPVLALCLTTLCGLLLFAALGKDPMAVLGVFFWEPIKNGYAIGELLLKATPLILIALGLSLCFRANVWNIGAEGQYVIGALCAGGVALHADAQSSSGFFLLVMLAGCLGGMLWAGLCALLRDRFHANEILVSLMLVYVAIQLLAYMVNGPWKDPDGYNFPQSKTFAAAAMLPKIIASSRLHWGFLLSIVASLALWFFMTRTRAGFALQVGGTAPAAARYAGYSPRVALWGVMLFSGACAGLAGGMEVAGPIGQLTAYIPVGYGFSAIIVAFVGRLHPVGVVFSALLMSMFYIGGEIAQSRLGLPKAITSVFLGLLLFMLLACDTLIAYRFDLGRIFRVYKDKAKRSQKQAEMQIEEQALMLKELRAKPLAERVERLSAASGGVASGYENKTGQGN